MSFDGPNQPLVTTVQLDLDLAWLSNPGHQALELFGGLRDFNAVSLHSRNEVPDSGTQAEKEYRHRAYNTHRNCQDRRNGFVRHEHGREGKDANDSANTDGNQEVFQKNPRT
jgi:hypothetical protein